MTQEAGSPKENKPELLPISQMEKMSHSELYMARDKAKTPEEQKHIAAYEHRAFAREYVSDNPITGAIGLAVAIPAYQAYKAVAGDSRTGVNVAQVAEGYKGVAEGLKGGVVEPWKRVWNDSARELAEEPKTATRKPWEQKYNASSVPIVTSQPANKMDEYLDTLAQVESGGNSKAKAPTSSATGLHQFTASTWMAEVNAAGLPYTLADRKDPEKSKEVARLLTVKNANRAREELGREPTNTELYMYHFLGSAGRFLNAPRDALATSYIGKAAAEANKAVFEGKTVGEVIDRFKKKFGEK